MLALLHMASEPTPVLVQNYHVMLAALRKFRQRRTMQMNPQALPGAESGSGSSNHLNHHAVGESSSSVPRMSGNGIGSVGGAKKLPPPLQQQRASRRTQGSSTSPRGDEDEDGGEEDGSSGYERMLSVSCPMDMVRLIGQRLASGDKAAATFWAGELPKMQTAPMQVF